MLDHVNVTVQVAGEVVAEKAYTTLDESDSVPKYRIAGEEPDSAGASTQVSLEQLAFARSGDKGNNANIGVMARSPEYLPYIQQQVTAQAVEDYFAHLVQGEVERFELPGMSAFNFFMTEALGGGGTGSVRTDAQGKSLAQQLLSMEITVPVGLA